MESRSAKQLLIPEGEGKERVKEADDVKLEVAEDTDKVEMEGEHDPGTSMTTGCRSSKHDRVYEYSKGKEKVDESNVVQIIIVGDNAKGKEKVIEANMVQIIITRDKGEGKDKLKKADGVKLDVPEDTGKGKEQVKEANEEELDVPKESDSSIAAQRRLTKDEGQKEESHVDARMASESQEKDSAQTNAAPYAESSAAAQSRLTKGEGEMQSKEIAVRSQVEMAKFAIKKVHSGLRDGNDKHYEPVLVSIGPYHYGRNTTLQDMEKHKVHYFQVLLERVGRGEQSSASYFVALENRDGDLEALHCYVDTFQMATRSFQECLVLDGLFVVELFRRNLRHGSYKDSIDDTIFNTRWMKHRLERDLLLFENQIPLIVLMRLMVFAGASPDEDKMSELALKFFQFNGEQIYNLVRRDDIRLYDIPLYDIPHLLGLVYHALVMRIPGWRDTTHVEGGSCKPIRSAVALEEVGVKFVKSQYYHVFFHISFRNGELEIPPLVIDDNTESFFRNLVAYEQYSKNNSLHRVVDYLQVMDCLINSPEDVELLRHREIIDNRIGDDVKISSMFNHLCSGVYFDRSQFFYAEVFDDVNEFCNKRRNVWMAKLKNQYFGSPWSIISFVAAVVLLLFTAFQTGYSVASYYQPKNQG